MQLIETAKTLTKPKPRIAQVVWVRRSRSETDALASSDAGERTQLEMQSRDGQTRTTKRADPQLVRESTANCRQGPGRNRFEEASKATRRSVFLPRVQKTAQVPQVQSTEKMVNDTMFVRTSPTVNSKDASDSGSGTSTEW